MTLNWFWEALAPLEDAVHVLEAALQEEETMAILDGCERLAEAESE